MLVAIDLGSNHLEESESRPFAICPVDLRKLQATLDASRLGTELDFVARERRLAEFFEEHGPHTRMTNSNPSPKHGALTNSSSLRFFGRRRKVFPENSVKIILLHI